MNFERFFYIFGTTIGFLKIYAILGRFRGSTCNMSLISFLS